MKTRLPGQVFFHLLGYPAAYIILVLSLLFSAGCVYVSLGGGSEKKVVEVRESSDSVVCIPEEKCFTLAEASPEGRQGLAFSRMIQEMTLADTPFCDSCKKALINKAPFRKECPECSSMPKPCAECIKKANDAPLKEISSSESGTAFAACDTCTEMLIKFALLMQLQECCGVDSMSVFEENGDIIIQFKDEDEFPEITWNAPYLQINPEMAFLKYPAWRQAVFTDLNKRTDDLCFLYAERCPYIEAMRALGSVYGPVACPAVQQMNLAESPICNACKRMILKSYSFRKQCPVCSDASAEPCEGCVREVCSRPLKSVLCEDVLVANANCRQCELKIKKYQLVRRLLSHCRSHSVQIYQNDQGMVMMIFNDESAFPVFKWDHEKGMVDFLNEVSQDEKDAAQKNARDESAEFQRETSCR